MRILAVGAALAAALLLAGPARAQVPTNVKTRSNVGNGFDFSIAHLISSLRPSTATTSSTANAPVPIARPQSISPRDTSLKNFLPKVTFPSTTPVHGFSTFPSEDQMPGAAYLKAFGLRVAPRVPIN